MSKQSESHSAKTLTEMALGLIDKLRDIRRFLFQPSTHPDWERLTEDMPNDLRTALRRVELADEVVRARSLDLHEAKRCVDLLKAEFQACEQSGAGEERLTGLREGLERAKDKLGEAKSGLDAAVLGWKESGSGPLWHSVSGAMAAYENEKKEAWIREHCQVLRSMASALRKAIAPHQEQIDGHPGRLGLRYPESIKANSATGVLLRITDSAVGATTDADLAHDLDQLQLDVVHELSTASTPTRRRQRAREVHALPEPRRKKPSREAVDGTAKTLLTELLKAALDAGSNHVPKREEIALAVSKNLDYPINVSALFGTEEYRGERRHRHPEFMVLWNQLRTTQTSARDERSSRSRGVAESATDEEVS